MIRAILYDALMALHDAIERHLARKRADDFGEMLLRVHDSAYAREARERAWARSRGRP